MLHVYLADAITRFQMSIPPHVLAKDTIVAMYNLQTDVDGNPVGPWGTKKKVEILLKDDQFTCREPGVRDVITLSFCLLTEPDR